MFINPLPRRLKEARKRKGLTQKKVGLRSGMDDDSAGPRLNQYEQGRHTPDLETLDSIAKALETPVPFFYCQDEVMANLICEIGALSNEQQKELLVYVKQKTIT